MIKTLRLKIFVSFLLLVALLTTAGTISIVEFRRLSNSVFELIGENYKSIEASRAMLSALEREDSGVLMLLLGEWKEGRKIVTLADQEFVTALSNARENCEEKHEEAYISAIEKKYFAYKNVWEKPIVDTEKQGNINWYKDEAHEKFQEAKDAVSKLMNLNQGNMYQEASDLKEKSKRAIMPGIISFVAAVFFALLLNFFIGHYFVRPLSKLADAVCSYRPENGLLKTNITFRDEIKKLEQAINALLQSLQKQ